MASEDFSTLKRKLLVDQTEEQIYQFIITTPYEIGEKLPNEFELAQRFGVGRSTIREAVKALAGKHIVDIRHGSGTFVIGWTPTDLDPLGLSKVQDKLQLAFDLVNVRLLLEPSIAEMAAINATAEDVEAILFQCDETERLIRADETYISTDIAFHSAIAKASGNMVIEQLIPIIDTAVMMFVNVTHKKLTEETVKTHRMVTQAIAAHDSTGAKCAMEMHLLYNREAIETLLKEQKEQRANRWRGKVQKDIR